MKTYTLTEGQLKTLMLAFAGGLDATAQRADAAADKVLADLGDPDTIIHKYIIGVPPSEGGTVER